MTYPPFHPANGDANPMTLSSEGFEDAFPTELDCVERKTGLSRKALQEAVVGFSNTDGGVLLIGVEDDGNVVGKELTQGTQDTLFQVMREVRQPGRYEISQLLVGNTPVTVLAIARRREGFAQTSDGRVVVCQGTSKVSLYGDDLRHFVNDRTGHRFEETETNLDMTAVSSAELATLAAACGWTEADEYEDRLIDNGLLSNGGKLTVAGALCLTERPDSELGKAYVEVFRYAEGSSTYDRRVPFYGPLRRQLEEVVDFIVDELGEELVVLGVHRYELARLPREVLREAVANALAHRSYEASGTPVRVDLRPDRLVITSPGGLPEPVTVENMRRTNAARNHHVIVVLRRLGLAEDAGRGVDIMIDRMQQELLDPPRFREEVDGAAVEVTLPVHSAVTPSERAWIREVEDRGLIESRDRVVLVHAARGESITNGRVRDLLNVDQLAAREILHRLRDNDFLEQRGERGGASYILKESLAPPAGLRLAADALDQLVLDMASEAPVTNARMRQRTGLDRPEAFQVLDRLTKAGKLRRVGQRRGTRYVLLS